MRNKFFLLIILLVCLKAEAQTSALNIADSLYAVGEYSKAIAELKNIQPKNEEVYVKLASNFEKIGKWNNALEEYKSTLIKNPDRVLTAVNYGKLLMKSGKISEADSLFKNLERRYPQNANFKYQLGLIKEKQNDSTALEYYKQVIALDSTHQEALYKLAKNALKNADFKSATEYCLRGLVQNDKNPGLLSLLAQTYFTERYYFIAVKPFEKLISLDRGSEYVHSSLGLCYYEMHKFLDAINQYKLALQYNKKNSNTHFILGKLYAHTGDFEKSEAHLLKAIEIENQPIDAEYLSLAITYKYQENYKSMLKYTQKAIQENPQNERAFYERAIAADNYFKDLETRKKYYQDYLDQFEETGNKELLYLAKSRISDITEEIHMEK